MAHQQKKIEEVVRKNIKYFYNYEEGDKKHKILVYSVPLSKKELTYYVYGIEEHGIPDIKMIFEGFNSPKNIEGFSGLGYITSAFQYDLRDYILSIYNGLKIIKIVKGGTTKLDVKNKQCPVEISYDDYLFLHRKISKIRGTTKRNCKIAIADFLHQSFPDKFDLDEEYPKLLAKNVISGLDPSILPYLSTDDKKRVDIFIDGYLKGKYKSKKFESKQISETKIKIDTTTLDNIIKEFEELLLEKTLESTRGDFLKEKIFLTTGKYIAVIPEINVKLGGDREVDFGLLDVWRYLDIYEIKRHSTKLLAPSMDRDNYYWHPEAVKAIVQAEKYLHNAKKKSSDLEHDLKDELIRKGIDIPNFRIIEPKAFLVIGHSDQLNDQAKKDDFRILRQGLKNVEIILYDELLETLKNQRNKFNSK